MPAIARGVDLLGGVSYFAKAGEKILLKPNILFGSNPDQCIITHPAVFMATGRLFQKTGATIAFGDSPGLGKCEGNMRRAGYKDMADEAGFILADFDTGREVLHKEASLVKRLTIASGVLESDGLISISKLKTHGLTRFTGAIKNQFGCIPGLIKSQFHVKLTDPYDFSAMLVDINTFIRPRLYIMDGIMAMEGNGPRSGKPRKMNVLLFSTDPVALDAVACRIINLKPEFVPTALAGEKAGLGTYDKEDIEVVGEVLESFIVNDFNVVRRPPLSVSSNGLVRFFKNQICEKPVIDRQKCTACGTCVKMCPVQPRAVDWHSGDNNKPPSYRYDRCIRCFCCQEICPEGAISIVKPLLAKIMSGV